MAQCVSFIFCDYDIVSLSIVLLCAVGIRIMLRTWRTR